ncbi:MAG: hypothetical protein UY96_C0034G0011 [Parcubacteria group bacterium GW2011_GWB1_56_8]|nr:MAG: hypothetical protein UY96_C0034G0011 [Parcubacteria group bacterium GW2011_GWB1_56_8]
MAKGEWRRGLAPSNGACPHDCREMIKFEQKGDGVEKLRRAVDKFDREYRKQIATTWRKHFRAAAREARALISGLFGGRGIRLQRAFRAAVSMPRGDVLGRLGYIPPRNRTMKGLAAMGRKSFDRSYFWWLGRIYEGGATIRHRGGTGKGRSGKVWVPIGDNRDAGGAARVRPAQFFSDYQGRSLVRRSAAGNLIAFRKEEEGLVPMFALKDQVSIKARPVAGPMARKFLPIIIDATGQTVFSNFRGIK